MLLAVSNLQAQWLTESFALTNGWNAIFLNIDAAHTTIDALTADANNPIREIWRWTPPGTAQFVDSPQRPIDTGSQWLTWTKFAQDSKLQRLVGNSAYLVRVANASTFTWNLKGKVVAPLNEWTTTGLNFVGFPTRPDQAPSFESFLLPAPELQQSAEIYYYPGGDLGLDNPARLFALRNAFVTRGQAYWIRTGTLFNRYLGPVELRLSSGHGIDFGTQQSSATFRLKNVSSSNLVVTLTLISSEAPPAGQPAIVAVPPLLLRGARSATSLTYGYSTLPLNAAYTWNLAASGQSGSEVEVVLGLNRSAISGSPGSVYAGILRFTDSLGYSQVDAPVSAAASSTAGLWVGKAVAAQVGQYLKTYVRDAQNNPVVSTNGNYVVGSTNTSLGGVAKPLPLRLILQNPETGGSARLFQRLFVGPDGHSNVVVASQQAALHPNLLKQARRVSATHLPYSADNSGWAFDGRLSFNTNITVVVTEDYRDQGSNPFLHTYHPDHDNLDAQFKRALPQGSESYTIQRTITLRAQAPGDDFASLTSSGQTITGEYLETLTVLGLARAGNTHDTREFQVRGSFALNRISEISTLTTAP